jgi:hypothetical protein
LLALRDREEGPNVLGLHFPDGVVPGGDTLFDGIVKRMAALERT